MVHKKGGVSGSNMGVSDRRVGVSGLLIGPSERRVWERDMRSDSARYIMPGLEIRVCAVREREEGVSVEEGVSEETSCSTSLSTRARGSGFLSTLIEL